MTKPATKAPARKRAPKVNEPAPPVLPPEMFIPPAVVTEVDNFNRAIAEVIHAGKGAGIPQGFIVAVLQSLTLQQTQLLLV